MGIEQNQMAKIQALPPLRGSIGVKLESTHPAVGNSVEKHYVSCLESINVYCGVFHSHGWAEGPCETLP
jgi:hypothetical protein